MRQKKSESVYFEFNLFAKNETKHKINTVKNKFDSLLLFKFSMFCYFRIKYLPKVKCRVHAQTSADVLVRRSKIQNVC